jgi:hypothetical protein
MVTEIQENKSFNTYNTLSRDINVSVDQNTHEERVLSLEDLKFKEITINKALELDNNLEGQSLIKAYLEPTLGAKIVAKAIEEYVLRKANKSEKKSSTFDMHDPIYPYELTAMGVFKHETVKGIDGEYVDTRREILATPAKIKSVADDLDDSQLMYKLEVVRDKKKIEIWHDQGVFLTKMGINKLLSQGIILDSRCLVTSLVILDYIFFEVYKGIRVSER